MIPTFDSPSRKAGFKLVKRVRSEAYQFDPTYEIPVYLRSAGNPAFGVPVQAEVLRSWEGSRHEHYAHQQPCTEKVEGATMVIAARFDDAVRALQNMVNNHRLALKNAQLEKWIGLRFEICVPGLKHNDNHFSNASHLVGLRADIQWKVGEKFYTDTGSATREVNTGTPDMTDLSRDFGYETHIPFTEAAWATVQKIENTLISAARALKQLQNPEQAQLLLETGKWLALPDGKSK